MPRTEILLFQTAKMEVPMVLWLEDLAQREPKAYEKCLAAILMLEAEGFELRRPQADILRDGIYELRVRLKKINYRILYFFHGKNVVVLSHGCTKEAAVDEADVNYAVKAKLLVEKEQLRYTATFGN